MMAEERRAQVQERLKSVPKKPGCYIYKDEQGEVLYVGKAILLRSRVRSYFQKSAKHGPRISRLVYKTADIEWIVVDSELEALVLECNLIKQHRPPYNVRLRDDKSYPFILVTKEAYPRLLFTRNPKRKQGRAYGPYTSAFAVRETLSLLHKVFPLIPCGKHWSGREEQRPCLYYHLGQCMAPCAGLSDKNEYRSVIKNVEGLLQGKEESVIDELNQKMERQSEALEFEDAARTRDQIEALRTVQEKQKVLAEDGQDRDVIAVVKDDRGAAIQMLYVRGGRLIGQRSFVLDGSKESAPTEAVQEFVKQYYSNQPEVPREILLPVEIEERNIVQQWLKQRRGAAVSVDVPQGGEGLRLVDLAAQNAEQALKTFQLELEQKEQFAEKAGEELGEAIGLDAPVQHVEGYDISNIQGTAPVGSMVVFKDAKPSKDDYRRFRIKFQQEGPNDFAMMHELIARRLRRHLDGDPKFAKLPDLIMIDGGKGQLSSALKARDMLGLNVPMVGLAKKQEIIYVPEIDPDFEISNSDELDPASQMLAELNQAEKRNYKYDPDSARAKGRPYRYREVVLQLNSPGLMMLRQLRDEAHRFAISFHRKVRSKRAHGSILDEVPGIGPKKKRLLLRTFGSVEAIRRATVEEIAAVPTLTLRQAGQIKDILQIE